MVLKTLRIRPWKAIGLAIGQKAIGQKTIDQAAKPGQSSPQVARTRPWKTIGSSRNSSLEDYRQQPGRLSAAAEDYPAAASGKRTISSLRLMP